MIESICTIIMMISFTILAIVTTIVCGLIGATIIKSLINDWKKR